MKKLNYLLTLLLLGLLIGISSCTKNNNYNYVLLPDDECGNGNNGNNGELCKVNFTGNLESIVGTRSMSPLGIGRYANIYAFDSGTFNSSPAGIGIYTTQTAGIFTPTSGPMYLLGGEYDFYTISSNDTKNNNPTSFVEKYPLANDIDYIWAKILKQDIQNRVSVVPITYNHCCSQIVVKVVAGENVYLGDISSITITPSTPGNSLSIQTGIIPPATTIESTPLAMHLNKNIGQVIMVPLKTSNTLKLSITAEINAVGNIKTFTVDMPVYNGEFQSGHSYLYEAIIDADEITFSNVNLVNWIDVDNSGNPLYPQPTK